MSMISKFPGTCVRCKCRFPAGTEIEWRRGEGASHINQTECEAAKRKVQSVQPTQDAPTLELGPVVDFLKRAKERGLKQPKLRVLDSDGKTELRLSLTTRGQAPGSLAVTRGGEYIGCVRPTGAVIGVLGQDAMLRKRLLVVTDDPVKAAQEYAALMCRCSFCGLELTDAGSVEVGYGPICAKNWGLPHSPMGTPVIGALPEVK